MKLSALINALESIAPTRHAEPWDNVGLLAGDPQQEVSAAMIAIDYTPAVAEESAEKQCDCIIAYHPPIFAAVKRLTAGHVVFDAIRRGVAVYSPHTAWDVAPGGANDFLADVLGLAERAPLRLAPTKATGYKLVTFVPNADVENVSDALFAAGAGRIGKYSRCSFQSAGTGTFFGEEGASPADGAAGQMERVAETRLETVVENSRVEAVINALRQSHRYEEPAFDLNQLAAPPEGIGQGRFGSMPPTPRAVLFERIKRGLEIDHLLIAGPLDGDVRTAGCCAGAGGEFLDDAMARKADLYLTGEIRHHDALKAAAVGMTVVCALHSNSERASLKRLRDRLATALPELSVHLSQKDRDPFLVQ